MVASLGTQQELANAASNFMPANFPSYKLRSHHDQESLGRIKVLSSDGKKNLGGPYKTKKEADKRLRQVESFKRRKG